MTDVVVFRLSGFVHLWVRLEKNASDKFAFAVFGCVFCWFHFMAYGVQVHVLLRSTNPPRRPARVVCLGLRVTSSNPHALPWHLVPSTSTVCLHPPVSTPAWAPWQHTRIRGEAANASLHFQLGFTTGFRQGRYFEVVPDSEREKYAFEVGSEPAFYVTAGVKIH